VIGFLNRDLDQLVGNALFLLALFISGLLSVCVPAGFLESIGHDEEPEACGARSRANAASAQ
jgi:hypothetical protein